MNTSFIIRTLLGGYHIVAFKDVLYLKIFEVEALEKYSQFCDTKYPGTKHPGT
jgi:hypothetical protein